MHGPHSVFDIGNCSVIHCEPEVCRRLTNEKQRKTDTNLTDADKSWCDYRSLNQNWSYQLTFRDTDKINLRLSYESLSNYCKKSLSYFVFVLYVYVQ